MPFTRGGSVALSAPNWMISDSRWFASCLSGYDSEQSFDEALLPEDLAFRQPTNLTFSNDVHCFIARDRAQGSLHGSKSLTGRDPVWRKNRNWLRYRNLRSRPAPDRESETLRS
jgi:hypothetical protein